MTTDTKLKLANKTLDLSQTRVMGILNLTPDSFSDGGRFNQPDKARAQVKHMLDAGADIIDIGGESTRPGAAPVSEQEELDRVLPLVEWVNAEFDTIISVDTSSPQVIRESARLGAHLINDVRALERQGAMAEAVAAGLPVCLMHMKGQPGTMQTNPDYHQVVGEVYDYLDQRMQACISAGIPKQQLLVDPGFGFGKTLAHNLALLNELQRFAELEVPVLVGMSRKTMIGEILDKPVDQRMQGSVAAAVIAAMKGAQIIRVHDVGPTVDAIRIVNAVKVSSSQ